MVWHNEAFALRSDRQGQSPQAFLADYLSVQNEQAAELEGSTLRLVEISDSSDQADPRLEERLHDSLTGVLSREAFADELDQAFAGAEKKPFALLFIDLNDFKQVNDKYGHLVGDDCLRAAGQRLSSVIRGGDAVGRFGGDEFLILLRGVAVPPLLRPIESRLRSTLVEPIEGPEGELQVGVSVGAAYSRDGYGSPAEMVAAADRAMYQDKRAGQAASR